MNAKMARSIKQVEPGLGDILDSIYLRARHGHRDLSVSQSSIGEQELYELRERGYEIELQGHIAEVLIKW